LYKHGVGHTPLTVVFQKKTLSDILAMQLVWLY